MLKAPQMPNFAMVPAASVAPDPSKVKIPIMLPNAVTTKKKPTVNFRENFAARSKLNRDDGSSMTALIAKFR